MYKVLQTGFQGVYNFVIPGGTRLTIGVDNPNGDAFQLLGYLHSIEQFPNRKAYQLEPVTHLTNYSTTSTMYLQGLAIVIPNALTADLTIEVIPQKV
jgi:hypothetical protein